MKGRVRDAKFLKCLIALLVMGSLAFGAVATAQDSTGSPAVGPRVKTAPHFELPDLNGSTVSLSQYKGERPVLLYFWATWCPYCIAVKPQIAKLREKIGKEELEILGVNVGGGDSLERVKKYQQGHPVAWPILFDGEGKTTRAYQVQGIPMFVLVDKEGNEAYRGTVLPEDPLKYLQ